MAEPGNVRERALVIAAASMEAAWLSAFLPLLVPALRQWSPLAVALGTGVGMVLLTHFVWWVLPAEEQDSRTRVALVVIPVTIYLLAARWLLFPEGPWWYVGWVTILLRRLVNVLAPGPAWGLLVAVMLAWWRVLSLVEPPTHIGGMALRFRAQVLALVAGIVILSSQTTLSPVPLVWLFFWSSLVALALVRAGEMGEVEGPHARAFDRRWIGITVMAGGIVVGLSALLAHLLSFQALTTLWNWSSPAVRWIGELLFTLLVLVGVAIGQVVLALVAWLTGGRELRLELAPLQVPEAPEPKPPEPWTLPLPSWAHTVMVVFQYVLVLSAIILVLVGMTLLVRRERERRRRVRVDLAPAGDMGETATAVQEALAAWWDRVRGALHLLRQYGPSSTFLAALSVQNIYVNLLRWAALHGYPRQPAETPYEHLHRLRQAFPGLAAEMGQIVDAFVAAHYGALSVTRDELAALRAAWVRIQQAGHAG